MKIKDYIILVIGSILIGTLYYYVKDGFNESNKIKQYENTIDSLEKQIIVINIKIQNFDSIRINLDSQIIDNKKQLSKIANKANYYQKKYNEEQNRLRTLSNDDIIAEFSDAFNYD